jgi:hypothetical protein
LGWRWLGRVRGRDGVELKRRWYSCKQLFERATQTPVALGIGQQETGTDHVFRNGD